MVKSRFDKHWDDHTTENIPITKINAAKQFLKPMIDSQKFYEPCVILDAGCGDGVHIEHLFH